MSRKSERELERALEDLDADATAGRQHTRDLTEAQMAAIRAVLDPRRADYPDGGVAFTAEAFLREAEKLDAHHREALRDRYADRVEGR